MIKNQDAETILVLPMEVVHIPQDQQVKIDPEDVDKMEASSRSNMFANNKSIVKELFGELTADDAEFTGDILYHEVEPRFKH